MILRPTNSLIVESRNICPTPLLSSDHCLKYVRTDSRQKDGSIKWMPTRHTVGKQKITGPRTITYCPVEILPGRGKKYRDIGRKCNTVSWNELSRHITDMRVLGRPRWKPAPPSGLTRMRKH
jgi:hypothetical protein